MDSSISIPLDLSGLIPPSLSSLAPSLPLVDRRPVAEVVAPPVSRARMQPNITYAFLLTLAWVLVMSVVNAFWGIAAVVTTTLNGQEVTPLTVGEFATANASAVLLSLFLTSCFFCVGVAAIAFRGQLVERLSLRKFTRTQLAIVLMLTFPLVAVISSLAIAIMSLMGIDASQATQVSNDGPTLAMLLFTIAVLPAIGEEVLFRGLFSRGLIARHGAIAGVLFATALFALIHVNSVQVMVIFFMGLVMQLVFLWTRSLLASILLHGLYNAVILIVGRYVTAPLFADLPLFLVSLLAVAALLVVLYQTRTQWQLPDGKFWSPGYVATDMPPRQLNAVAVNAKAKLSSLTVAGLSLATLAAMLIVSGGL